MDGALSRRSVLKGAAALGVAGTTSGFSQASGSAPGAKVQVGILDALQPADIRPGSNVYETSGLHEQGLGDAEYFRTDFRGEASTVYRRRVGPHLLTLNEPVKRIEYFGARSVGGDFRNLDCTDAMAEVREYAMERGDDGITLVLGEGRHHIEAPQVMSKIARFRVEGVGGRIVAPHQRPLQIGGSEIVNGTGSVLFDFVDDVSAPGDWHPCGVEFDGVGFSQPNKATDIVMRFRTQWPQPRIRRCAFLGGKHAYDFGAGREPYDVECEDVFFFNMATACFMPDIGQPDYLHMIWRNCTWRYNDIAVESEIGNTLHFQGGLVEANRIGLKLGGVRSLVELGQGLHFEQQLEQDIWITPGPKTPSAVTKVLTIDGVSATWNKPGGQLTQIQIDDALNTIIQGNGLYAGKAARPGDQWVSLALNQPADRAVQMGLNAIDGEILIAQRNLRINRQTGRPNAEARTRFRN